MKAVFRALLTLVVLSAIGFIACTKRTVADPANVSFPWVRLATAEVDSWRTPETALRNGNWRVLALVSEGLTRLQVTDNGTRLVGNLAQSWVRIDPTHWLFTLREGLRWSDGTLVTPSQIVESWHERIASCKKYPSGDVWKAIRNAVAHCQGKAAFRDVGLTVESSTDIQVTTVSPDHFLPFLFAHPATWPTRSNQDFKITLGSFFQGGDDHGEFFRFIRNKHALVSSRLAGVEIRDVPSIPVRTQLFADREIDIVDDLTAEGASRLMKSPELKLFPTSDIVSLIFKNTRKPFHLSQIRKALVDAIDRSEPLKLQTLPLLNIERLRFDKNPSNTPRRYAVGTLPDLFKQLQLDPANLRLWEESAWKTFPRPTLTYSNPTVTRELAENFQAQWIRTAHLFLDLQPAVAGSSIEVSLLSQTLFRPHDFFRRFHSESPANLTLWKNSAFDQWVSTDSEESLAKMEQILVDDEAIVVPLYRVARCALVSSRIRNLAWNPASYWDLRDVTVE